MKTNRMLAAVLFMAATLSLSAQESVIDINKAPNVSVQAVARREVVPDELRLGITIRESDYKQKHTLEEKQKDLIDVLKRLGINYEEELFITQTGSSVRYKFLSRTMKPRSRADYQLILHDAATMQRVVKELEKAEISNISLMDTRYTKVDELKNELNLEAIKKAQAEARILAQGVNQEIGKALVISSWMQQPTGRPRFNSRALVFQAEESVQSNGQDSGEETPSINKLTYTVNVSVRFELK